MHTYTCPPPGRTPQKSRQVETPPLPYYPYGRLRAENAPYAATPPKVSPIRIPTAYLCRPVLSLYRPTGEGIDPGLQRRAGRRYLFPTLPVAPVSPVWPSPRAYTLQDFLHPDFRLT